MKKKEYKISCEYKEVPKVSIKVSAFCKELLGSKSVCGELEICLVESLNNIIKHAYKEDTSKSIEVVIEVTEKDVIIKAKDRGISRKDFKKPILEYDPDDIENLPEGGMGLFIIDQLMDEVTYKTENGVNIFTMKKNLA